LYFSTLESGLKKIRIRCRIRRVRVNGSRIRTEKFADSKISGYLLTGFLNVSKIKEKKSVTRRTCQKREIDVNKGFAQVLKLNLG